MQNRLVLVWIFLVLFGSSCGIKGPPLPPIDEVTVQKQKNLDISPAPAPASTDPTTKATKKKKAK